MTFFIGGLLKLPPKLAHAVVQFFRTSYTLQGAAQGSDCTAVLNQLPLAMVRSHMTCSTGGLLKAAAEAGTHCGTVLPHEVHAAGSCPGLRLQGCAEPAAACHDAL